MIPRLKLIAAVLGLVVATGAIGDASARLIDRAIIKKTIITRPVVAPRLHRVVVLPARPVLRRLVASRAPVLVRTRVVTSRIVRAPVVLKRSAFLRRTVVRKTVIR